VEVAKKLGEEEAKVKVSIVTGGGGRKPEGMVYDEKKPEQKHNCSPECYLMNTNYLDDVDFAVAMREHGANYNNYKSESTVDDFEEEKLKVKVLVKEVVAKATEQLKVFGIMDAELPKHKDVAKGTTMKHKDRAKLKVHDAMRVRVGVKERMQEDPGFVVAMEKVVPVMKVEKGAKKGGKVRGRRRRQ